MINFLRRTSKLQMQMALAIGLLWSSHGFAIGYPGYSRNVALVCGDIYVVNDSYTTRDHGYMVPIGDLGNVSLTKGRNFTPMVDLKKTAGPAVRSTWLGLGKDEALGFGLFESDEYRLDLRNVVENNGKNPNGTPGNVIQLEDKKTGQKIKCEILGDCC